MGGVMGAIGGSQDEAQAAYLKYKNRLNAHQERVREEEKEEEKKARNILQEFIDRPRPEKLPHACQVVPGLWLGSLYDAMDEEYVDREKITHAVSGTLAEDPFHGKVQRLIAIVDDEDPGDIWKWFEQVCEFIDEALAGGGHVLVHCEWGVSRSPTLVAAYLMRKDKITPEKALDRLKELRDCVHPNKNFLGALDEWSGTLKVKDGEDEHAGGFLTRVRALTEPADEHTKKEHRRRTSGSWQKVPENHA